jgi:hypothetical protein
MINVDNCVSSDEWRLHKGTTTVTRCFLDSMRDYYSTVYFAAVYITMDYKPIFKMFNIPVTFISLHISTHNRMQKTNIGDYHVYRRVRCVVHAERRVSLHVKCPSVLSYFNQNINLLNFVKMRRAVQELLMRTDGHTDMANLTNAYLQLFVANALRRKHGMLPAAQYISAVRQGHWMQCATRQLPARAPNEGPINFLPLAVTSFPNWFTAHVESWDASHGYPGSVNLPSSTVRIHRERERDSAPKDVCLDPLNSSSYYPYHLHWH